jgi:hypothetical protein
VLVRDGIVLPITPPAALRGQPADARQGIQAAGAGRNPARTHGQFRQTRRQDDGPDAPATPEGFIGQMFKVLGRHLPPPAGVQPPSLWGTHAHLHALFGDRVSAISATPRLFNFRYRSAAHMVDVFRSWYGPVQKAFQALSAERAAQLEEDLIALMERMRAGDGDGLVVPSEYLEIVITRR